MDITIEYNPQTKIISRKEKQLLKENVLGKLFFDKMKLNKGLKAQIHAPTGEFDTYQTLLEKSIRTAIEMKRKGLKAGDIISICSYNQLNTMVPYFAAQFLGIIVAPLDPTIELKDIKYLLNIVKPVMIFISDDCENWIENAVENLNVKIVTFGNCTNFINFNEFLKPSKDETNFEPTVINGGNEIAVILFTSGTTSYPKGIPLSHNFLIVNSRNMSNLVESTKIALHYSSLYWIGVNIFILTYIEKNITRLLCRQFEAGLFWKYVEQYSVDSIGLLPSQAINIYNLKPTNYKPTHLKYLLIAGGAISSNYLESIKHSLPDTAITMNYGLTEVGIVIADYTNNKISNSKEGTVGFPLPEFQFKIVDIETEEPLGFNKVGELRIKPSYQLNGYYNKDSSDCFDKDGFFKTGDMLYYDKDFCFYVSDRIKAMFKYRGWHIIPAKLEAILEQHQDVQFAAVIGIPNNEDDNHAVGVVVLHKGATITEKELQKFVDDQVEERNKLRGGVRIVKSFPYTPTGKIARNAIKNMIIDNMNNA